MTEKKSILLLASAAALTLALHESALYASPADESVPPVSAPTVAAPIKTPAVAESPAPEPVPPISEKPGTGEPTPASPEPATAGTPGETSTESAAMAPEPPPPIHPPMPGTREEELGGMTAEKRAAQREQRFQEMHERFMQQRQELAKRWDSYWKILDAMTPEQKEAIEAVFGRNKGRCAHSGLGRPMPSGTRMHPQFGQPEHGFPSGSSFPGYGYGSQSMEPFPFERGAGASWPGDQPMHPGGFQPWYGGDRGSFQGPPAPGGDYGQSW